MAYSSFLVQGRAIWGPGMPCFPAHQPWRWPPVVSLHPSSLGASRAQRSNWLLAIGQIPQGIPVNWAAPCGPESRSQPEGSSKPDVSQVTVIQPLKLYQMPLALVLLCVMWCDGCFLKLHGVRALTQLLFFFLALPKGRCFLRQCQKNSRLFDRKCVWCWKK